MSLAPWQELRVSGVSKRFDAGVWIIKDIDLTIEKGSFVCILGPSGCGKSTLLDMLAGFERPTQGQIGYDDRMIEGPGPDRVVIFQDVSNALFPWLSVEENVAFGIRGQPLQARQRLTKEAIEQVGLSAHFRKFPSELSGGMKQRAQIARGLVMNPDVLLMDEHFGALDAFTRQKLQVELKRLWSATGKTIVFITHDVSEAITLATHVIVMSAGPGSGILDAFEPGLGLEATGPSDPAWVAAHHRLQARIEQAGGYARAA
jgi:NitT/TauT family transport system ATP-binding protein